MTTGQPPRPANIQNIVAINQGRRPLTMDEPRARALPIARVAELVKGESLILDIRSSAEFGDGHVPGAFNIQITSSEFEQRVGWVMPADRDFLLGVGSPGDADMALLKLAFVGLDSRVPGYFSLKDWRKEGREESKIPQLSVADLQRILGDGKTQLLDVREAAEWDDFRIPTARHTSFKLLEAALAKLDLKPDRPVAVICATGKRSSTGGSILLRNGFRQVFNVTGGMEAWRKAGLPTHPA